jgi:hypothetical protein
MAVQKRAIHFSDVNIELKQLVWVCNHHLPSTVLPLGITIITCFARTHANDKEIPVSLIALKQVLL